MTSFRKFSGSKTIWMKDFGPWTETSVLRRKWFLRVVKGALQVPSATLEKNMIKVSFTFCVLFRTLCVFFCSERKVSQGWQNHNLGVQRKIFCRIFLTQTLFQNVFWFRAEELAVLAENHPHRCQIYYLWVLRNISGATFSKQVLNISIFPEC